MFLGDSKIRFFKLVGFIVNNMQRINTNKGTRSLLFSIQSVKVTFKFYQMNIWCDKLYFFHLYLPHYSQLKSGTSFVNNMTSSANKYKKTNK